MTQNNAAMVAIETAVAAKKTAIVLSTMSAMEEADALGAAAVVAIEAAAREAARALNAAKREGAALVAERHKAAADKVNDAMAAALSFLVEVGGEAAESIRNGHVELTAGLNATVAAFLAPPAPPVAAPWTADEEKEVDAILEDIGALLSPVGPVVATEEPVIVAQAACSPVATAETAEKPARAKGSRPARAKRAPRLKTGESRWNVVFVIKTGSATISAANEAEARGRFAGGRNRGAVILSVSPTSDE